MATHGTHQPSRENAASPGQSSICRSLCLLLLLAPLGCAHTRPGPLPEATKEQLGTIGVVAAQFTPEVDYRTPGRGGAGGAAIGTAKGLGLGIAGAALCFISYGYAWPACGLAIATPYLATRLAMDQARAGVAPDTIEAAESVIKAVLAERSHGPVVRDEAFRLAAAHTGHTFVLLPDPGPTKPTEAPCYRHLAAEGIDTVLEIAVQRIVLGRQVAPGGSLAGSGAMAFNPYLTLVVTTQRRVVKTATGTTLYEYTGDNHGRGAAFTDWGANDGQLLRDGLDQLLKEIAGEIVSQVFGVAVPPPTEPAPSVTPTPGTESEPQTPSSPDEVERPAA